MRALGITVLALSLLSLGLLSVVPEVAADHVYTHRYQIEGRVVNDAGQPVAGATVEAELRGWLPQDEGVEQPCDRSAQKTGQNTFVTRTDQQGDYRFCIHVHRVIDTGSVVVTVGDTTEEGPKDVGARVTTLDLQIDGNADGQVGDVDGFEQSVFVRGHIWQPLADDQSIEGIPAKGVTPSNKPITVLLELPNGTTLSRNVTSDNYGVFETTFQASGDLTGATITMQTPVSGETYSETYDVDPTFRALHTTFVIDRELETADSPGFGVLAVAMGAVLAVGLVTVARQFRR